jgi:predicted GH43/DUF377 family glycosyl hydrolase
MRTMTLFFGLMLACGLVAEASAQVQWERHPGNPVFTVGDPGSWEETVAVATAVLYHDGLYKMWYEGDAGFGYATSPDGLDWTRHPANPVLVPGDAGEWDELAVNNASVVIVGDTYHLWYSGVAADEDNRIGHATSTDGMDWTKDPANPVMDLGQPGDWDSNELIHPFVIREGDLFRMWYNGHDGLTQRILYASSPDGVEWTRFAAYPMLEPGQAGAWDDRELGPLYVLKDDESYRMWYTGWNQLNEFRIGYATSPDGLAWTKDEANNPVLSPGEPGSWDDALVGLPVVLREGGEFVMWYGGASDLYFQTGFATAPDETPVLLSSFSLQSAGDAVMIAWEIAAFGDPVAFRLSGSDGASQWPVAFEQTGPGAFLALDRDPRLGTGGVFEYALELREADSDWQLLVRQSLELAPLAGEAVLEAPFPNPFNPQATVAFRLSAPRDLELVICDSAGRRVRLLALGTHDPGRHVLTWKGLDDAGRPAPSGVYFAQLKTKGTALSRKLVLLR